MHFSVGWFLICIVIVISVSQNNLSTEHLKLYSSLQFPRISCSISISIIGQTVKSYVWVCVCVYSSGGPRQPQGEEHKPQKGKCTYDCNRPKGEEGWRLRRMLLSSSVILWTLPPFSPLHQSKQPHRIKISHCWTYTKRQGFSWWGDTSNILATFKNSFDIERWEGLLTQI